MSDDREGDPTDYDADDSDSIGHPNITKNDNDSQDIHVRLLVPGWFGGVTGFFVVSQ